MVWPSSVVAILETFFINNRKTLHILEMFRSVTVFAQGLWFWQVSFQIKLFLLKSSEIWCSFLELKKKFYAYF